MNNLNNEVIVPYHGAEKVLLAVRKIIFDTEPGALRPMSTQIMIKTLVNDGMPEALAKKLPSQIRKGKPLFNEWKASFISGRFMQKIGRSIKVVNNTDSEPQSCSDSLSSTVPSSSSLLMSSKQTIKREHPASYASSSVDAYESFFDDKKRMKINHMNDQSRMGSTMTTSTVGSMFPQQNEQKFSNISTNFQSIVNSLSANYGAKSMVHSNNFNRFNLPHKNHYVQESTNNMNYYSGVRHGNVHDQHCFQPKYPSSSNGLISPLSPQSDAQMPTKMPSGDASSFSSHMFHPMSKFPNFNDSSNHFEFQPSSTEVSSFSGDMSSSRSRHTSSDDETISSTTTQSPRPSPPCSPSSSLDEYRQTSCLASDQDEEDSSPNMRMRVSQHKTSPSKCEEDEAANVLLLLSSQ